MSFAFIHLALLFRGSGPVGKWHPSPSLHSASSLCCWLALMDSYRSFFRKNLCDIAAPRKSLKIGFFLFLHSCLGTSFAQAEKHSVEVYLRIWFLKAGQTHSQNHLQGKITPDRTSIGCSCQRHGANIDFGVVVVGRVTGTTLNTKPCSVADKQLHHAVYCNA